MSNVDIKHAFVSAKADTGTAAQVKPSNWNANHDVAGADNRHLLTRHTAESDGARWLKDRHAVQTMRGMHLRTHPDADKAAAQVMLVKADEVVLSDGERISVTTPLTAAITSSGAGGLDVGAEAVSEWYEVHLIRNPTTATTALMLHLGAKYIQSMSFLNTGANLGLRDSTANTKLAQSFKTNDAGNAEHVTLRMLRVGTPTGTMWATLEADVNAAPSGTALATSDTITVDSLPSAGTFDLLFLFRSPVTLLPRQTYWLVLQGNYTISGSNYVRWYGASADLYADGNSAKWDGSAWSGSLVVPDFSLSIYVTRAAASLALPSGFTARSYLGNVYNDSSGNFSAFVALNRRVKLLLSTAIAPSASALSLVTASLPPRAVLARICMTANGGAEGKIGGVPDGYTVAGAVQSSNVLIAKVAAADQAIDMGWLCTQYHGIYGAVTGSGSVTVWVAEYMW